MKHNFMSVCGITGTGAAQQHLLPALMRVYAAADTAIGLDVDKDAFDKFRSVDGTI